MSGSKQPLEYLPLILGLPKVQKDIQDAKSQQQQQQPSCQKPINITESINNLLGRLIGAFKDIWAKMQKDKDRSYHKQILILTLLSYACLFVIVFMSFILIIKLQYQTFKRRSDMLYETRNIPYKEAIEYQAIQSLELFASYPYQGLYILSIIGLLLVALRAMFIKQRSFDELSANPGTEASKDPSSLLFIIFVYVFAVCFICIQLIYRKKVTEIKDKIVDFNQYVRALLPANYDLLLAISSAPTVRITNNAVIEKLGGVTANIKDISRSICVLNLYEYYISQYADGDANLTKVLGCFDPVNRLIATQGTCFSDYMMRNANFIENKVIKYLRVVDTFDENNEVRKFILQGTNRLEILTEVDNIMGKLNEKANCLDSTTAFIHFTKMAWMIFSLIWIPLAIYGLILYYRRGSASASTDASCPS